MSEVAIWQPGEVATTAQLPNSQLDDWIMVADKVVRLAEVICRSPFVPDGLRGSVPATAAAILTGRELGIPPMTSLANIHVIHGKPGLSALVMRALVLSNGHEWQDVEVTNTRVVVKGRRKGEAEWTTASFSTADAQTAKLQLGGYPQDKLYARASARLARRKFADVIAGMPYSIEELEDGIGDLDRPGGVVLSGESRKPLKDAEQPAPRTARRRQTPAQTASPAGLGTQPDAATAPAASPAPPAGEAPLPPLPGEEETSGPAPAGEERAAGPERHGDPNAPGSITKPQLTKLGAIFTELGFTRAEREQRLVTASVIVGRELESSNDLSRKEAGTLIDTLEACGGDRERLIALLAASEQNTAGEASGQEGDPE